MKFSIKSLFSKCDQIRCKLGISVVFSAIWFLPLIFIFLMTLTAWKMSVFGVFLVRIFLHSDWIRRHNLSVSSPDTGKYGPEKLRIRALFTQYLILVIRILLFFFLNMYLHCAKNEVLHYGYLQLMRPNPQETLELVTLAEEILIGKLHFFVHRYKNNYKRKKMHLL